MFQPRQNWLQLSAIQMGGAFSLPVFIIGYFLGSHYRINTALFQIFIGNSILLMISLAYLRVIVRHRVITIDMARFLFGNIGNHFAGISTLISMLGWSVIQWQFIANACVSFIQKKSNFLMFVLQGDAVSIDHPKSFVLGLLIVFSVASGLLFDLPTFYRHARTETQGKISLSLLWMLAVLGVESLGVMAANHQGTLNFIDGHRLGFVVLIVITGFLTNGLNIYSAGMMINRLFHIDSIRAMVFVVGLTGVVSMVPIGTHLPVMLQLMGASAETILCVTLTTVHLKGLSLTCLTELERRENQQVFFLTMIIMLLTSLWSAFILKNSVVVIAIVSVGLMFINNRKYRNEATNLSS